MRTHRPQQPGLQAAAGRSTTVLAGAALRTPWGVAEGTGGGPAPCEASTALAVPGSATSAG
ncbi:hypothetical protein E2C01_082273 [Portunus trituberculatus]|uniref:Uncharacterized protein n=1 Tax=Portunus trituberculatus TaxID=210409 RepID=A0A5B7IYS3_PORTR|nr:hypothetical protein [Portunus trituberculatus]